MLDQLPRLISGYGKTFANDPPEYRRIVVVICDLDNRDKFTFLKEIEESLSRIKTKPTYYVCPAIEEGEAWLLGDKDAIFKAYPRAIATPINSYSYDSICGTWEKLADSLYTGGSKALKNQHYSEIGKQKNIWAKNITPHIQIDRNQSPSLSELISSICKEIER
ncbi:hypothetical protein IED13_05405 [Bosea sp. SSUT16]|uniref:DUF4276 family protein n=1 Tax=Bosea spartocytisi TaxID=2773451 RepID=A0A927E680_9HYPH|nr:hypothetical protein [Bosea spartocytisi]MBD3845123.1 hypothetical protein [Bosea spartocytisi]MCT4472292.1 DUF4276 family protein [Bosea spartocytisi]